MLLAYCDESGTHLDSQIAVIGGYVSTVEEWCLFIGQWRRLLERFRIPFLHMNDLNQLSGPYTGWNEEKRTAFLDKAHTIIKKRTKAGFASAVRREDFLREIPQRKRDLLGGEYGWCTQACLATVSKWAESQALHGPISWVFEKGHTRKREVIEVQNMFFELSSDPQFGMIGTTWDFADKDLSPLQAADAITYETYKQAVRQYDGRSFSVATGFHRREARSLIRTDVDLPNIEIWHADSLAIWNRKTPP
jgi:hypothetical protein